MSRIGSLASVATALAAVAVGGGLISQFRGSSQEKVIAAPIERGRTALVVKARGTVNPAAVVVVGSHVSGIVEQVNCDYNTVVSRGQLCAKIDPRQFQAAVDVAKANLAVSQAQLQKDQAVLAYAKVNYERNAQLVVTNATSRDIVDLAKSRYEEARAQIDLDEGTIQLQQAQLAAAEVNLGYTNIVSPVDGVVIARNVATGETVAASYQTPKLFTIANDLRQMRVYANVAEADIGRLKVGQAASFTVDSYPERSFASTVLEIRRAAEVVQDLVTYPVVISAANADQALLPGMTANVQITVEENDRIDQGRP
jgi:HlyD family secretion protein